MIFWQLFITFFKIGLFSFGGGYAMLALIQNEVVTNHAWVTVGEFTNIIAVSQVTPGPIAINSATYIGYQASGSIWGAFWATLGVTLPSVIVITILFLFLNKFKNSPYIQNAFRGLKPTVIGLILSAALVLMTPDNFIDWISILICAVSFILCYWIKLNPILLIFLAGGVGILLYA